MSHRRTLLLLCLATLGTLVGCDDIDLRSPQIEAAKPQTHPASLVGTFCADDPQTLVFPVKVWFVIDDTGSMTGNDPQQRRYSAVKEAVNRLANKGRMFFGGMVFSTTRIERFTQPDRFTDDPAVFGANVDAVANPGNGGTPYLAALEFAYTEIDSDILENPRIARRTRYVLIFLSDGEPTDGSTDAQRQQRVDKLVQLGARAGGLVLNTVYLGGSGSNADNLLKAMSQRGGGTHKSFPNGDTLDYSGFDFSSVRRNYTDRLFVVMNRSMLPVETGQVVDSDGDGLSDAHERMLGTDPKLADTDGDGCADLTEVRLDWSPTTPGSVNGQCRCADAEKVDTDGDLLTDCEERWIGADPRNPDSDQGPQRTPQGDLVPDLYDYLYTGDVLTPNLGDRDVDGLLDLSELQIHTSAMDNDVPAHPTWAYRHTVFQRQPNMARCVDFAVENVSLGKTLATPQHAEHENLIELYFAQSPLDDPYTERTFKVARLKVPYSDDGRVITVRPEDFSTSLVVP